MVFHAVEEVQDNFRCRLGEAGVVTLDHYNRWDHMVVAGGGIIVEHAGVHLCLADDIVG